MVPMYQPFSNRPEWRRWGKVVEENWGPPAGQGVVLEHFRRPTTVYSPWLFRDQPDTMGLFSTTEHVAVLVVPEAGVGFVGRAVCGWRDPYNRRVGYNVAVGRVLKAAAQGLDPPVVGWRKEVVPGTKAFRDWLREWVV